MKKLFNAFIILLILQTGFSSCRKTLEDKYKEDLKIATAKTTAQIKASTSFKWNTTTSLNVNFKALPGDERISILKVSSEDGNVVMQKLQAANENFTVLIEIPVHYEKLNVSFGSTTKLFETKSGKIDMDLN